MRNLIRIMASTALVLTPLGAAAQPAPAGDGWLDEITVTARRMAENLQRTPVSVTVVTNDAIEELSLFNIGEVQNITPNLQYNTGFSGSSSGANFFIRGIGQLDFLSTSDPGVALFLDGVYIARTVGSALDTADIERIEVLKGPQGTLFGKNTIGGAINITTAKPDGELKGFAEATVGNFGRYDGRFMANVPITDRFFVKLTGVTRNNDGFQTRVVDGIKLGDDNNVGGSIQARFVPSDDLDILLAADVTRRRAHIAAHTATTVVPSGGSELYESVTGVDPVDFQPVPDPWKESDTGIRPTDDLNVFGTSLTVNYDLGGFDLRSISAYRKMSIDTGTDFDGTQIPYNDQLVNQDQEQFSQELQVSQQTDRFKWLLGVYYLREEIEENIQNNVYLFYAFNNSPLNEGPVASTDLTTDNFAVYGQGTFNVTEQLSITAGLRWMYEKKKVDINSPFALASGGEPLMVSGRESWDNLSPRLGIEYQATPDMLLYASVTRGFKSGSFNGRADRNVSFEPYDPEKVWAYEVGFKSEFWENRARLNAAAFWTQYDGIQLVTGGMDENGVPYFPVDNAGNVEIKGFEVELTARPVRDLSLFASVGYADEKWTDIFPIALVTENTRLPMMSHVTAMGGAAYSVPLTRFGSLTLGVNYSYRSAHYMDTNNSPRVRQGGYGLLDARAVLEPESGVWELQIWGKNLTDENYVTWAQDLILIADSHTVSFVGRPREYGATVRINF